jgi:hypothetical protein
MNTFVSEMNKQNVPKYAIDMVEKSPDWIERFRTFDESQIQHMIDFYPVFYKNVINPLNTPNEMYILTNEFTTMVV